MLYETNVEKVELIKELEVINNILEIHQVRFGEKLSVEKNIEGDIGEIKVAPLIFIPFVENALKHCRQTPDGDFFIRIVFHLKGKNLLFSIENSFSNSGSELIEHGGIGLQNARKRLNLIYPGNHELTITTSENVFRVQLNLKVN
jgi:LytS/YehU family sensor histidine kinase